jgi:transcriptional regulator with XRE-family HTH domain
METFGERLEYLRIEQKISQRQLSKNLEVGKTTISSWEGDVKEPTLSNIVKLAKYFKVSSDYLLGLED